MANDKMNGSAQRFTEALVELVTEANEMVAERVAKKAANQFKEDWTADLNEVRAEMAKGFAALTERIEAISPSH